MVELFTYGRWTVEEGRETEFVDAWRELAEWSLATIPGAGWARLLQDRERPNVFLSFGPWDDLNAVQEWRSHEGFVERIGNMRGLLQDFEANILDPVAEVG